MINLNKFYVQITSKNVDYIVLNNVYLFYLRGLKLHNNETKLNTNETRSSTSVFNKYKSVSDVN